MGIVNKYKINELAKDFGMQTKQIIEILGSHLSVQKKSGQNLDDKELNFVFEYLTQHNQVSDIKTIYADPAPAPEKPAAPAKGAQPAPQQPQAPGKGASRPQQQAAQPQRPQQGQQGQPQKAQQNSAAQQQSVSRVPKTKVVDPRKATNVNLDKYDEELQDMAVRTGAGGGGRRDRDEDKEK